MSRLDRQIRGWLDHLQVERGVSRNTIDSYARDLRRYADFLASRNINDATASSEAVVTDFLAWLRTGDAEHRPLAASSSGRTLIAVRGFHRFLVLDGQAELDPASEVAPPSTGLRLPKALGIEQVEAILGAAKLGEDAVALRDSALLELLYGLGARIGEAVGLDVDDLDLEAYSVRLRGKGDKERIVPLGSYASGLVCQRTSWPRSHRIPSGTRMPLTCLTGERTSAWCRNFSATPQSPRPRSTRTCQCSDCGRSTPRHTREPGSALIRSSGSARG